MTLTSYHECMDFGFVGSGATMYDLPQLSGHVQGAYEELKVAASKRRPAGVRKTHPRRHGR